MSSRTFLAAAVLVAVIQSPALARQVPQALESYKPHEIVEAVISEARPLSLDGGPGEAPRRPARVGARRTPPLGRNRGGTRRTTPSR